MAHRIWKETKQQPGRAGTGNMLGCCLVSFHFLWAILSTSTVGLSRLWMVISSGTEQRSGHSWGSILVISLSESESDHEHFLALHTRRLFCPTMLENIHSPRGKTTHTRHMSTILQSCKKACPSFRDYVAENVATYSARAQHGPQEMERNFLSISFGQS